MSRLTVAALLHPFSYPNKSADKPDLKVALNRKSEWPMRTKPNFAADSTVGQPQEKESEKETAPSQAKPTKPTKPANPDNEARHNSQPTPQKAEEPKPAIPPVIRKISKRPQFRNEHFKVDKSSIAGWGAFAVKDLQRGDVILREEAVFIADSKSIFNEFNKLDRKMQRVARSLHSNYLLKDGTPHIYGVWVTNCFAVGGEKAGLFAIAARFNHACAPVHNMEYRFDRVNNCLEMTVRAERIAAGEELSISYGEGRTPDRLYLWYGFRCSCGACKGISDWEIKKLTTQW